MQPTVYLPTRGRLAALLVGASTAAVLCVVLPIVNADLKMRLMAPFAFPVCVGSAVMWARRLRTRAPELVITDEGIVHRTWGQLGWGEVKQVVYRDVDRGGAKQRFIEVMLKDPKGHLSHERFRVRLAARFYRILGFSPVSIATSPLPASLEEVLHEMEEHHKNYLEAHDESSPYEEA